MRIAVFKFNNLGDNVIFVPVVQALRARFPEWRITLFTSPREAELYAGPLAPHQIILCRKHRFEKSYRRPWELAWWMLRARLQRPDACLLPYDQATATHLVAKFTGARVRIGGNLSHIRVRGSLTEEIRIPSDGRLATWNWEMGRALATALGRGADWPDRAPPPDLRHLIDSPAASRTDRPRVVVHAGSSRPLNRWPEEKFAAVASALAADADVVWIKRPEVPGEAPPGTRAIEPSTLRELATALGGARLFVGNNSGPMHLANAIGTSGVIVVGPSAFGWDPYWHRERWRLLRPRGLECAPCEVPNEETLACANTAFPMACFAAWSVDAVVAQCRELLAQAAPAR